MNTGIDRSAIAAVALLAITLAACDSIQDVRDDPYTELPTPQQVLQGTVSGLGSRRPVELQNNADEAGARKFFGTVGATLSPFTFDAVPVGSPYAITVKTQPYGKTCTVTNGTGTVGNAAAAPITVNCVNDAGVTRFPVTVNTAAVTGVSNLRVSLTTEEGTRHLDATGLTSVVFADAIFNSQTSLPVFEYVITATTTTTEGGTSTSSNCALTGGRNVDAAGGPILPTGPVAATVTACSFVVAGNVAYSTPPGGVAQALPAEGLDLALRDHFTGSDVQTLTVNAFGNFAFPTPLLSHARALYELVVTRHPPGQHCVVSGTTTAFTTVANAAGSNVAAATAGAVMLVDPSNPEWWAFTGRAVRCRNLPVATSQLTGIYQTDRPAATETTPNPSRAREFLGFFSDGSFLYGISWRAATANTTTPAGAAALGNANAASGVVQGFYHFNTAANTITFTVFTATNTNPSGRGINGMPGYAAGAVTASNVLRTAGPLSRLSLTFTGTPPATTAGGAPGTGTVTRTWAMTEPPSTPGELTGTWITPDHRRMFIYNNLELFGFHAGVNGLGTLQDACFVVVDGHTQSAGLISRHGGSAVDGNGNFTCLPGGSARVPDLPHYATTGTTRTVPRVPPSYNGRFPGSGAQLDNRPTSPISFSVTPGAEGAADTLSAQETLNGVLVNRPLTLLRYRVN